MVASSTSAWLFPGQGSQYAGMGRDLWNQPGRALEIVEEAERLSGLPLRDLSLQGPESELRRTDVLQPALTAVALGCLDLLHAAHLRPAMVAGHSLGEFPALCAAGVLTVEDCLRLVTERGRLMQHAALQLEGGMAAIKRVPAGRLREIAAAASPGIAIANYNAPDQLVVSGPLSELALLLPAIVAAGGEYVPLPVAGPWHHHAMTDAAEAFSAVIERTHFSSPACPVFMNVSGQAEQDAERIKTLMKRQMTAPVLWQASIEAMSAAGAAFFVEVGPGKVMRGLLRRILPDESRYRVRGVEGRRGMEFLARETAA